MNAATCPNCQQVRDGAFCSTCGQNARDYRRSLPPMVLELLREAFELDGRILRSLKLLLFRPGALSLAFSENRRADFVSPVRLYIFASLVFFFVFAQTADFQPNGDTVEVNAAQPLSGERLAAYKALVGPRTAGAVDDIMAREGSLAHSLLSSVIESATSEPVGAEPDALKRYINIQLVAALHQPQKTLGDLLDNSPLALFFLLPIYALLLKLLYWRSQKYYVEHFVFALHLHAFAFLLFTALALLPEGASWVEPLSNAVLVGFFVYYFLSLRRYYAQGGAKTMLKFGILLAGYTILLLPSVVMMMAITVTML